MKGIRVCCGCGLLQVRSCTLEALKFCQAMADSSKSVRALPSNGPDLFPVFLSRCNRWLLAPLSSLMGCLWAPAWLCGWLPLLYCWAERRPQGAAVPSAGGPQVLHDGVQGVLGGNAITQWHPGACVEPVGHVAALVWM
jgi:hypothetical protein